MGVKGLKSLLMAIALGAVFLMMTGNALAATSVPASPDAIAIGSSGRHGESAPTLGAEAGNVTAVVITDSKSTNYWQGYYGNVTGRIVLDDGDDNTLFAWELVSPSGEVYAVNTSASVNWANITCVNMTGNATRIYINKTNLHAQYGITNDSWADTFDRTFNETYADSLVVGPRTIVAGDNCPLAYTFVNQAYQKASFRELLLFDNKSALVYTSILERNINGYQAGNDDTHDFQMLVGEDGSPGGPDTSVSTYYFYVELE